MRGLKICLWITGLLCLLAVVGLFLPVSTMRSMTKTFTGQDLPDAFWDAPATYYMIRVMSATYAGIGLFYIILALRPLRHGPMVPCAGLLMAFIGVVCGVTGVMARLPVSWYLSDCIFCLALGILILVFWRQARAAASEPAAPEPEKAEAPEAEQAEEAGPEPAEAPEAEEAGQP